MHYLKNGVNFSLGVVFGVDDAEIGKFGANVHLEVENVDEIISGDAGGVIGFVKVLFHLSNALFEFILG